MNFQSFAVSSIWSTLKNLIKYTKYLAKNEEIPCSTCLNSIMQIANQIEYKHIPKLERTDPTLFSKEFIKPQNHNVYEKQQETRPIFFYDLALWQSKLHSW